MGGGIGGLLHSLRDGAPKYNLGNGRGDIVAQTDQAGALTWTASYEAFGKRPVETGTNADRQRANTKEEDPTGLLWEHFRYRDLETGVWLSRDPAGFVDGPNLYAYVRQNPWSKFDPLGLSPQATFDDEGNVSWTNNSTMTCHDMHLRGRASGSPEEAQTTMRRGGSLAADFVPYVGTAKGGYEVLTGTDPVTGDTLSTGERVVAGVGTAVSAVPGGKLVARGIGKAILKSGDETVKVVESAQDVVRLQHGTSVERAKAMMENGPDDMMLNSGEIPGISFTTPNAHALDEVPAFGSDAQAYARARAKSDGSTPAVLTVEVPRSLFDQATGAVDEKRFMDEAFKTLRENWDSYKKQMNEIPE